MDIVQDFCVFRGGVWLLSGRICWHLGQRCPFKAGGITAIVMAFYGESCYVFLRSDDDFQFRKDELEHIVESILIVFTAVSVDQIALIILRLGRSIEVTRTVSDFLWVTIRSNSLHSTSSQVGLDYCCLSSWSYMEREREREREREVKYLYVHLECAQALMYSWSDMNYCLPLITSPIKCSNADRLGILQPKRVSLRFVTFNRDSSLSLCWNSIVWLD